MTDTTVSTTEAPVIADAPTTDTDHPSSSTTTKMMIDSNNDSTSTNIITNNNNGDNETAVNESAVGDPTNNNTNKRTHSQMMQHSSESHDDHEDDSKSHETTTTHQNKSAKMKHNEEEEEDDEMTIDDGEEESSSSTLTSVSSRNHQHSNNTTTTTTTPTNTTPAVTTTSHPSSSTSSPTITSTSLSNDTTNLSTTQNDSEKQQEQQHESSTTKPTMISHQNDQQQQPIASTPSLSTTTPTDASTTTVPLSSSTTTTASSADAPTTTSSATTVPALDSSAMTDTVDPSSVSNIDTVQQQKRFPSSINYTVLTPEKMIENPIILRGCDANTMWDMKELVQLRENLKQMYEKSKRIIRIYKKDLRKIDFEIESKHFLPKSKRRRDSDNASDPTSNHNANGTSPEKQMGRTTIHSIDDLSGGDSCDDEDEFFAQTKKVRLCGYVDAKGHACKRKGFCPFHHKSYVDQQSSDISRRQNYYYRPMSRYEFFHDSAYDVNRTMLAANKKEKLASLKVSTLLVAAAALERNSIEEQPERKVQEQTAQVDAQQYEGDAQHVVQPLSSHDTYTNQPLSSAYQQQPHYGPTDTNVSQQTAVNGSAAVSGNQQQSAYTSHQQQPAFQAHSRSQQQQPMYEQPKSSYYEHNGSHNLPWINSSNPPERSAYQSSHAPAHHYAHQQQQQPTQHHHHHHQPVPPVSMSSQNRRTHEESYGLPHTFYPSESSHSAHTAAPPASAPLSAFHSALHPMQDMPAMSNSYQSSTSAPAADSSGNRPFNLPSLLSFAPSQPSSSAGRGLPSFLSGPPSSSPGHIPSLKELGSVPLGNLPFGLPPPIASSNQNQETQARPTQQQGAWDMSHARYHE